MQSASFSDGRLNRALAKEVQVGASALICLATCEKARSHLPEAKRQIPPRHRRSKNFRLRFASGTDSTPRQFHLLKGKKEKQAPTRGTCFLFGGSDENRTRVQRTIHTTFSVDSQSIRFPTSGRRVTGSRQGSFLMRDRYKSNSRFTCTTDLTHGESRSPLSRYGRQIYAAALPLGSHCNRIVVVYYLSLDIVTRLSGALRLSYFTTPVETIAAP